jgi:hypothetical protein
MIGGRAPSSLYHREIRYLIDLNFACGTGTGTVIFIDEKDSNGNFPIAAYESTVPLFVPVLSIY